MFTVTWKGSYCFGVRRTRHKNKKLWTAEHIPLRIQFIIVAALGRHGAHWSSSTRLQGEEVLAKWAEKGTWVSFGAVPVGCREAVVGHQPSVQDLGVSTGHCQSGVTKEERIFFFWTSVQVSLVLDTHTRLCPFAHLHRTFTTPHYTARLPQWPTHETTTKPGCKLARLQQSDTHRKRRREGGREGWWCRELMMILFFNFHLTSCRMIGQFLQKRVSVRAVIPSPFLYSFKLSPPMLTHLQL